MDPSLSALLRQFFALTAVNTLEIPPDVTFQDLNHVLVQLLTDPHFREYAPSTQYQQQFWKWVIQRLEEMAKDEEIFLILTIYVCLYQGQVSEEAEIDLLIYEHYLSLRHQTQAGPALVSADLIAMQQIPGRGLFLPNPPTESYITYFPPLSERSLSRDANTSPSSAMRVTLLESRTMIESGTTGLRTWRASFVLADYLIAHPDLISGRSVLELGSGMGFLGAIIASLQHSNSDHGQLWLTDVNEDILSKCQRNIRLPCNLSSKHPDLRCFLLNWVDSMEPEGHVSLKTKIHQEILPDLVLGADIVFDPSLIEPLVATLRICLISPETVVLLSLTVRKSTTIGLFLDKVKESDLRVEELEDVSSSPRWLSEIHTTVDSDKTVKIFRIKGLSHGF